MGGWLLGWLDESLPHTPPQQSHKHNYSPFLSGGGNTDSSPILNNRHLVFVVGRLRSSLWALFLAWGRNCVTGFIISRYYEMQIFRLFILWFSLKKWMILVFSAFSLLWRQMWLIYCGRALMVPAQIPLARSVCHHIRLSPSQCSRSPGLRPLIKPLKPDFAADLWLSATVSSIPPLTCVFAVCVL